MTTRMSKQEKIFLLKEKKRTGKSMADVIEANRMPEIAVLDHDAPWPADFKEKDIVLRRRKY